MKIARLFYPVKVLGPGNRVGIWTAGCHRRCKGCANPELWNADNLPHMNVEQIISAIKRAGQAGIIDGITISGGEPLNQEDELKDLLNQIHTELGIEDIILFTGYEINNTSDFDWVRESCSLVIDGTYDETRNKGEVLRGSDNQSYVFKNDYWKEFYGEYIRQNNGRNLAQNFTVSDGVVSVGIHKPDFNNELNLRLKEHSIGRIDNE